MNTKGKHYRNHVLLILALVCSQVQAVDTPPAAETSQKTTDQELVTKQVQDEIFDLDRRWYGLMRIRWQDTQKFSVGLGAMLTKQPRHADCSIGCEIEGWHFEVEPGVYGIQAGVGWGKLIGETGRTRRLMHTVHFGWNVRGVVMRTWGDNSLYPQSQTLAGVEGGVSIVRLNFSLGVLKSLYSGEGEEFGENWIYTVGIGWGF